MSGAEAVGLALVVAHVVIGFIAAVTLSATGSAASRIATARTATR